MVGLLILFPEQLLSCNLYQCSAVKQILHVFHTGALKR